MAKKSPRFLAIVEAARSDIDECEANDLRVMMDDGEPLVVLDVRERHEFEAGHLVGAVHIEEGVLEQDIEKHELADDARIVLYCGGGLKRHRRQIAPRHGLDQRQIPVGWMARHSSRGPSDVGAIRVLKTRGRLIKGR